jgi:predicted DNA binding CopG/RHH family protein
MSDITNITTAVVPPSNLFCKNVRYKHHFAHLLQVQNDSPKRFDFRRLHGSKPAKSKLITTKVPEDMLNAFKARARMANTPYQTQIKTLMKAWLIGAD